MSYDIAGSTSTSNRGVRRTGQTAHGLRDLRPHQLRAKGPPTKDQSPCAPEVRDRPLATAAIHRTAVPPAGGPQSPADQLAKLADLRDRGVITADEFEREKAKILA
jgi:hypothetical protein